MAIVKACTVDQSVKNTGFECSAALKAVAMLLLFKKGTKFTKTELLDFVNTITAKLHADASSRCYPVFGYPAPILQIDDNDADDITVTYDNGTQVWIGSGMANRTYTTNEGGLCFAQALRSFINSGFGFIEIDKSGQFIVIKNTDGTYSPVTSSFIGGKTPKAAGLKTEYLNRFQVSYDPTELLNSGEIYKGAEGLLSVMGLIDAEVTAGTQAATTSEVYVGVQTECADTDLIAKFGATLVATGNFKITNKATGADVTITAAAIVSGEAKLSATLVSGTTYTVSLASASTLFAAGIEGYEGKVSVDITIP